MKKTIAPLLILLTSFALYWIILIVLAIVIDSFHAGGEQYFLRILSCGIDLSFFVGFVVLLVVCIAYKEWAKRNKLLIALLGLIIIFCCVFTLFFNH